MQTNEGAATDHALYRCAHLCLALGQIAGDWRTTQIRRTLVVGGLSLETLEPRSQSGWLRCFASDALAAAEFAGSEGIRLACLSIENWALRNAAAGNSFRLHSCGAAMAPCALAAEAEAWWQPSRPEFAEFPEAHAVAAHKRAQRGETAVNTAMLKAIAIRRPLRKCALLFIR